MPTAWLNLFTPETWEEARQSNFSVTGFRSTRWNIVSKIAPGDLFICYLIKLSRFCGILEATSKPYKDENKAKQVWKQGFFPCLVNVKPLITFDILHSIPKDEVVPRLSIAKKWSGYIRGSPVQLPPPDAQLIESILEKQRQEMREYPIKVMEKVTIHRPSREQEYGIPIDFKGLRHAPLNEQGVIYLFALVAEDLGFIVEALGTSFPDCQAKRRMDKKGYRWKPVRIEFEYYSSDFKRHDHPVEGCDLIVCWKHDWPDCPLEVLELSEEIKKLGARFLGKY